MTYALVAVAVIGVVGAGVGAYSASEQASAAKKQAEYDAQVANNNAIIASNNARIAAEKRSIELQAGQNEAQRAMLEQSQMLSRQRVALASNGVDLNSGSALDLQASTKFLSQQDINAIQVNSARNAWGYEVEGINYKNQSSGYQSQSNLDRWKAGSINPTQVGVMTGVGSLLSSATQYAGYKASRQKVR